MTDDGACEPRWAGSVSRAPSTCAAGWLMRMICVTCALAVSVNVVLAQDELIAAGAGEHAWFAAVAPEEGANGVPFRLFHHATDMNGPHFRVPAELPRLPGAMTAYGDRVWLLFEPESGRAGRPRRELLTLSTRRNPATGLYFYQPPDRMELLPSLDADGVVAGVTATEAGVAVLVVPPPWRSAGVEAGEGSTAASPGLVEPRLHWFHQRDWHELPLPEMEDGLRPVAIARAGDPVRLVIASMPAAAGSTELVLHTARDASVTEWSAQRVTLPGGVRFAGLVELGGQIGVVLRPSDAQSWRVMTVRPGGLTGEIDFVPDFRQARIVGLRDRAMMIEAQRGQSFRISSVDLATGAATGPEELQPQRAASNPESMVPLGIMVVLVVVVMALVVRPLPRLERALVPEGTRLLDMPRRAGALLIDLAPAAAIALLVTGAEPHTLLIFPVFSPPTVELLPMVLTVVLTAVHSVVAELLVGRTLGKIVMRGHIITMAGKPPRPAQVLARNLLKAITLAIPYLVLFVALNPYRQHLGDIVARTFVIADPRATNTKDEQDTSS